MDASIRQLCAQLLLPSLRSEERLALENRLLSALEQLADAEAVLHFLLTEKNQLALFVAVELLAKANLKQSVCGIHKQFLLPLHRPEDAVSGSAAFLAKKRLIDGSLEVLVVRRTELEERLVDPSDQVDSLCNMVGAGLKTNWMELAAVENYGQLIEEKFFASQERLLVLVGRLR